VPPEDVPPEVPPEDVPPEVPGDGAPDVEGGPPPGPGSGSGPGPGTAPPSAVTDIAQSVEPPGPAGTEGAPLVPDDPPLLPLLLLLLDEEADSRFTQRQPRTSLQADSEDRLLQEYGAPRHRSSEGSS
jgi:hypothetical protein